ncbi:hypothetical protein D9613_001015 [Agrocybe pediades]|uniref:Uncharacterized protein n=1 Tax=Agrocybe pediades TaxID=84607 RepID=A0A8H4R0V3_9AGAR|nr:hypothetical protein D9613_001015 [Agrocybe pediades]
MAPLPLAHREGIFIKAFRRRAYMHLIVINSNVCQPPRIRSSSWHLRYGIALTPPIAIDVDV